MSKNLNIDRWSVTGISFPLLIWMFYLMVDYLLPDEILQASALFFLWVNIFLLPFLLLGIYRTKSWLKLFPTIGLALNIALLCWIYFVASFKIVF
jgi:hypothetical protein